MVISPNTQAILLLTAPLITGRNGTPREDLLTQSEYHRFARQLREIGRAPSDLLGRGSPALLRELEMVVPSDRIRRLLDRGFLFSQALERWQSRAIWVVSRADAEYPKKIKNRLKEDSPAVLYGCGQPRLLDSGGLAVVGSRHVDQSLIDYTEEIGEQCAGAGKTIISGGAQGIDRAAMRGALEAGGRAVGVLADSLERAALNRENRNCLLDGQLALISPYDPNAGFNIGHAMQRNKLIYALADLALVVSAEFEKGGTWTGATEQLQKLQLIPVYIRSTGEVGRGLHALTRLGAYPWPNPKDCYQLLAVFDKQESARVNQEPQLAFPSATRNVEDASVPSAENGSVISTHRLTGNAYHQQESDSNGPRNALTWHETTDHTARRDPAGALIACLRQVLLDLLATPKSETEIASVLGVSKSQTRSWLEKFVQEGLLTKQTKPAKFVVSQRRLL